MKTVYQFLTALAIASLVVVALIGVAFAHGTPTLTAKQATIGAGGTISVSGDGLGENGEKVTITLEGTTYQATLGTATLNDDAIDNVELTIPKDAPAGTYVLTAMNGDEKATLQIEVTEAAAVAQGTMNTAGTTEKPAAMAATQTPTITRTWTPAEWIVALGLLAITLLSAIVLLWRHRVELTAIDR